MYINVHHRKTVWLFVVMDDTDVVRCQ